MCCLTYQYCLELYTVHPDARIAAISALSATSNALLPAVSVRVLSAPYDMSRRTTDACSHAAADTARTHQQHLSQHTSTSALKWLFWIYRRYINKSVCLSIYLVLWRCWLGDRKGIRPVKTEWWGASVVVCLEQGADLHMAQLMPLTLTVSCFSKIQIGFTFLAPAHMGSPGKRAVKRVCVLLITE